MAPAGYGFTTANVGSDSADSDANAVTGQTGVYVLSPGEFNSTVDAGILPAALGDYVWEDANANGVQDVGEAGISGATVNLLDSTGTTVLATTTTDANGLYNFTGLMPGSYEVQFVTPAGGYTPTLKDQGSDSADSDADTGTGKTIPITLVSGQTDNTWDAGFYKLAAIGDFVWLDTNANGQQDVGELGVDGVTVKLLNAANNVIATTTTGDNPHLAGAQQGYYEFTGLTPGTYSVQFVAPGGKVFTTADSGSDVSDSDANTATGLTGPYTLASGDFNQTVDAGLISSPPGISIEKVASASNIF